jgi:hypothetical protein
LTPDRRDLAGCLLLLATGAVLVLVGGQASLGWVALAGVAAVVATSGALRRTVGGLLLVVGVGAVLVGLADVGDSRWPWLVALGGVCVLVAGGWVVLASPRWAGLSRRYEASTRPVSATATDAEPLDLWRALDRGEDPTDPGPLPGPGRPGDTADRPRDIGDPPSGER